MDSVNNQDYHDQSSQTISGLLRFRSAPSSLLSNFADNGVTNDSALSFQELKDKSRPRARETALNPANSARGYSGLPPHYPRQNPPPASSAAMDGSYGLAAPMSVNHHEHVKRLDSSLARQSSSPAGFLGNLSVQNGYASMKVSGSYAAMSGNTNGEVSPRLKSQLSFSSTVPSFLGMLSQISEIENESIEEDSPDNGKHGNINGAAFPYGSWNDSQFAENFNSVRDHDINVKLFSSAQTGELASRVHLLSHHLSLPKTSAEMASVEKYLHFQDSVPCKMRAKRGCATHPRSIAERVRRTRISERMRKLQELVPNMDKQTNTADMLDLAVEYIKDLQRQYKTLSDSRANCKCSSKQKPVQNQII